MKKSAFYSVITVIGVMVVLGASGCNSSSKEASVSPEQRTQRQAAGAQGLSPQAQGLAAQQNQQKNQMDSMRARDAAKAR